MTSKFLFTGLFLISLISCKKELTGQNNVTSSETFSTGKKPVVLFNFVAIVPYDSRIFSECANEMIHLTGSVKYNLKESFVNNKFKIVYEINFQQVKGIGETSGDQYSGGGALPSRVISSFDRYITTGTNIYRVRYNSASGHSLIFIQNAHYTMNANGTVTVEFND